MLVKVMKVMGHEVTGVFVPMLEDGSCYNKNRSHFEL